MNRAELHELMVEHVLDVDPARLLGCVSFINGD